MKNTRTDAPKRWTQVLLILALAVGCGGDGSAGAANDRSAQPAGSAPTDHLGVFTGRPGGGAVDVRLTVQEQRVILTTFNGFETTRCEGRVPSGVRRTGTQVDLDCGADLRMLGIRSGLSMHFSAGAWHISGTQSLAGLSGSLRTAR